MKERPILFSEPMVRALLSGTKTQTRRVMKAQPNEETGSLTVGPYHPTVIDRHDDEQPGPEIFGVYSSCGEFGLRCPYGQPGDRLWVRETHALQNRYRNVWCTYAADGHKAAVPAPELLTDIFRPGNRPSIHMPRWVSRITLEITAVRVGRLQDISEADAVAEGSFSWAGEQDTPVRDLPEARLVYRQLWEQINGPGSWDANPWVWVIEFRKKKC